MDSNFFFFCNAITSNADFNKHDTMISQLSLKGQGYVNELHRQLNLKYNSRQGHSLIIISHVI